MHRRAGRVYRAEPFPPGVPYPESPAPPLRALEPDALPGTVPEAVVQDAWAQRLFAPHGLTTVCGQPIEVLHPGQLNALAGPDFSGARIRVGAGPDALVWAGDVEIHPTSAGWRHHGHDRDPAYNRVVLHVVLSPDPHTGALRRADGTALPELVLLPYLDRSLRRLIHAFYATPRPAPMCAPRWADVPADVQRTWVQALGLDRVRARALRLARESGADGGAAHADLDGALVRAVFRGLGYEANAEAMTRLAGATPLGVARGLADPAAVHALLLGLSGLLAPDAFAPEVAERWAGLAAAHALAPIPGGVWRPGGRPANAPARRVAQAAALLGPTPEGPALLREAPLGRLRAALLGAAPVRDLRALLRPACPLGTPPAGRERVDALLINAVLPLLLLDAERHEDRPAQRQVARVVAALPAEDDRVTRAFAHAGYEGQSALDTQGVHHLHRHYCTRGHCARCAIGRTLYPAFSRAKG